jgi:hypothetical protein
MPEQPAQKGTKEEPGAECGAYHTIPPSVWCNVINVVAAFMVRDWCLVPSAVRTTFSVAVGFMVATVSKVAPKRYAIGNACLFVGLKPTGM